MRHVCVALACLLSATTPASTSDAHADPAAGAALQVPRLRPVQSIGRQLIDDGLAQSPTFRSLVTQLSHSDLIVYIEVRPDMPWQVGGSLRFVAVTPEARYVRVTINGQNSWPMMVALLGHELQHAVEVAAASEVRSARDLRMLYTRIGTKVRTDTYDSTAAQVAGRAVRAELSDYRAEVRMARRTAADEDGLLNGGSIGAP